ncbi:MAG: hypothetical protein LUG65_02690, partial [Clostridiales bacterium]|nr:hypothetical protein [Clostridiales bacterium]
STDKTVQIKKIGEKIPPKQAKNLLSDRKREIEPFHTPYNFRRKSAKGRKCLFIRWYTSCPSWDTARRAVSF